jgi:ubiquinone/menaquinone biosynthesis C-methylase UbiE
METKQRQWGKTEIRGGRHAFRVGLIRRRVETLIRPGAKVLDAGCGDGSLALALRDKGYAITALDVSGPGLERLGRRLAMDKTGALPEITYFQASLTSMPLPDESFDAAVSGEVLEHLDDDRAAVAELFRVLKPGGLCFVTVPANPGLWSVEDEWAGHKRRYDREGLTLLFEQAGFIKEDLHHWGWPVTWVYDRFLYRAWIRRKLAKGESDPDASKSVGGNPIIMRAMYYALSLDRPFQRLPWGIGLIGVFRKQ